jgi:hypothetical protein
MASHQVTARRIRSPTLRVLHPAMNQLGSIAPSFVKAPVTGDSHRCRHVVCAERNETAVELAVSVRSVIPEKGGDVAPGWHYRLDDVT